MKSENSEMIKNKFKRKFSFFELYRSLIYVPRAMLKLTINNKKNY